MTDQPVQNHPCDGCGQLDDHPMVHVMAPWIDRRGTPPRVVDSPSFHFDCLPPEFEALYGDGHDPRTAAGIDAAKSGVHGADLREFLTNHPGE